MPHVALVYPSQDEALIKGRVIGPAWNTPDEARQELARELKAARDRGVASDLAGYLVEVDGQYRVQKVTRATRATNGAHRSQNWDPLTVGTREEMEHTSDPAVARRIAQDHLREDPLYYDKLAAVGLVHRNPSGLVYYRGHEPGRTERIRTGADWWDGLLFVTDTPRGARAYGSAIERVDLKPSAKILREKNGGFGKVAGRQKKGENLLQWAERAARAAQAAGYDGIHFARQTDVGTAIWNRDVVSERGPYREPNVGAVPREPVAWSALVAKAKAHLAQLAAKTSQEDAVKAVLAASGMPRKQLREIVDEVAPAPEQPARTAKQLVRAAEVKAMRRWDSAVAEDFPSLTQSSVEEVAAEAARQAGPDADAEKLDEALRAKAEELADVQKMVHDHVVRVGTTAAVGHVSALLEQDGSWAGQQAGRLLKEMLRQCPECPGPHKLPKQLEAELPDPAPRTPREQIPLAFERLAWADAQRAQTQRVEKQRAPVPPEEPGPDRSDVERRRTARPEVQMEQGVFRAPARGEWKEKAPEKGSAEREQGESAAREGLGFKRRVGELVGKTPQWLLESLTEKFRDHKGHEIRIGSRPHRETAVTIFRMWRDGQYEDDERALALGEFLKAWPGAADEVIQNGGVPEGEVEEKAREAQQYEEAMAAPDLRLCTCGHKKAEHYSGRSGSKNLPCHYAGCACKNWVVDRGEKIPESAKESRRFGEGERINPDLFPEYSFSSSDNDSTTGRLQDLMHASGVPPALKKALHQKLGVTRTPAEQVWLDKLKKRPLDMGYVSKVLLYGEVFRHLPSAEHAALIKLIRKGDVRIQQVYRHKKPEGLRPSQVGYDSMLTELLWSRWGDYVIQDEPEAAPEPPKDAHARHVEHVREATQPAADKARENRIHKPEPKRPTAISLGPQPADIPDKAWALVTKAVMARKPETQAAADGLRDKLLARVREELAKRKGS